MDRSTRYPFFYPASGLSYPMRRKPLKNKGLRILITRNTARRGRVLWLGKLTLYSILRILLDIGIDFPIRIGYDRIVDWIAPKQSKQTGNRPMAREAWRKLTWDRKGNRWMKSYRGKLYRFPLLPGEKPRSQSSHDRCWREWLKKRDELDKTRTANRDEITQSMTEWKQSMLSLILRSAKTGNNPAMFFETLGLIELERWKRETGKHLSGEQMDRFIKAPWEFLEVWGLADKVAPSPLNQYAPEPDIAVTSLLPTTEVAADRSIGGLVEKFKEQMAPRVVPRRLKNLIRNVNRFVKFLGVAAEPNEVCTSSRMIDYRNYLLGLVEEEEITSKTATDVMSAGKQYVRWLFNTEILRELPRVMLGNCAELSIPTGAPEIAIFTKEEISKMLEVATARDRLSILLGLNCGAYYSDIASILKTELDLSAGTITRRRTKTQKISHAPIVRYRLWPETISAIKENLNTDPDQPLAFVTERGTVLADSDNGKNILSEAWGKMFKLSGISNGRSHKHLRKTGCNTIANNRDFATVKILYLGNVDQSIAAHYADSNNLLDEALDWLRSQVLEVAEG